LPKEKKEIIDLTAQIKLQDNEGGKKNLRERISKIAGGISTVPSWV
jgi:hypothetical protein